MRTVETLTLGMVLSLAGAGSSQAWQSRDHRLDERTVIRPSSIATAIRPESRPDRIVIKFRDRIPVRLAEGELASRAGVAALGDVRRLLAGHGVEKLFERPAAELDRERTELSRVLPASEAPLADLNNYYRVRVRDAADTARLLSDLLSLDAVETAYREPIPSAHNDIPPATPRWTSRQSYFAAAPHGYGYDALRSIVGMRAPGAELAHLEGSWYFGHEDQPTTMLGSPPTSIYNVPSWQNHGTACVGILGAKQNGYGVRGFASDARTVFTVSIAHGAANSISVATRRLGRGSVMSSSWGWSRDGISWPLDFFQAEFDAVRTATAKGIFYTFSAGNSGRNLEDTSLYGSRYLPTSTSSGGFIIGATDGHRLARASFSNYGRRIDANAWGRNVATTGYGDLFFPNRDTRQGYTAFFSGTSAAAPAVAGVIASYVSTVREQLGVMLSPSQVRQDLRNIGTAIPGLPIGRRPDLTAMLRRHGLPDGLLVTHDGAVGGSFGVEVRGQAGRAFFVLMSTRRRNTPSGLNRPLLIDPTRLFFAFGNIMPASGTARVSVPLPNNAVIDNAHWYLQGAVNRRGTGYLTNSAELWIDPDRKTAPKTPSNLRATAIAQRSASVAWRDNSRNENAFVVQVSSDGRNYRDAVRVRANALAARVGGLQPYANYWLRVLAENDVGRSTPSTAIRLRTACEAVGAPSLRLQGTKPKQITVVWTNGTPRGTALHVGLSTNGKTFTRVASLPGHATGYTLTGLVPDRLYYILVRAQNSCSNRPSNIVRARTEGEAPNAPTGLRLLSATYQRVTIAWTDNSQNEDAFHVSRSLDNTNWDRIAVLGKNAGSTTISGLRPNTRYYFGVRSVSRWGRSARVVIAITTPDGPPAPPTGMRATGVRQRQIDVTWNDNSHNEQGFHIGISTNGSSWSRVATLGANVRSYTVRELAVDTKYWVRVRAYNAADASAPSATTARTLPRAPAAPTGISFSEIGRDRLRITFRDNSSNENGFRIYSKRRDIATAQWILRATLPANDYDTRVTGLKSNKPYWFKVVAFNRGGTTESPPAPVRTK